MQLAGLGHLWTLSTEPLERQLVVVTPKGCYGVSPRDTRGFVRDCLALRALGALREVRQGPVRAALARLDLWRDRTFWLMVLVAISANVALLGLVMAQYPLLPARIPLRFAASGEPLHVVGRAWIFVVPLIGGLAWLTNTLVGSVLHRRERLAAHLLVTMAASVQAPLWFAVVRVIGR
jgi:hypothetical protein